MREGWRLLQRKAYLRVGGVVGTAGLLVRTTPGNNVAGRTIGEVRRLKKRTRHRLRADIEGRPRRQAAGDAQRPQEPFGNGIGFAACQAARAWYAVEALN